MAKLRVGINGFGRIGRVLFRAGFDQVEIVGINSMDKVEGAAHLLKYDSAHGIFKADVSHDDNHIIVNGKKIPYSSTKNPLEIPWKEWGVDVVLECTGKLKGKDDYQKHITAGAKKVFISAPADGVDLTVVYGINHESYDPSKHQFISNASCTTNCLAPLAKVLHEAFGIESGVMTTVHSYTNDQNILDASHSDMRRARAGAVSMIPTTTGAAKAVGLVLPELKGKIDGFSVRVPTPNVSMVDLSFTSKSELTKEAINEALIKASQGNLKGVLAVEHKELVSVDFNGNPASSTIDLKCTMIVGKHMAKVISWYDNETGFSHRMIDMIKFMAAKGL